MPKERKPKETQNEPIVTREHKLRSKAEALLIGLKGGERLTKKQWSKRLYGDLEHEGCLHGLIRTLRRHGNHVVLVPKPEDIGAFPPRPFIVQLVNGVENERVMKASNDRLQKDVNTRLETQELLVAGILEEYPNLILDVHLAVTKWLGIIAKNQQNYASRLSNQERSAR